VSSFSAERAVMEKSRWRSRPQAGAAGRGRRGGGCGEATEEFAAAALQMAAGGKGLESTAGSASRAAATFERKLTDAVWRQRAKWWRRGWDPVVRPGENAESTGELKT
jgi:hypothetical protein